MSDNSVRNQSIMAQASDNRIEALRSLATLLLREVESLRESPAFDFSKRDEKTISLSSEIERFEIDLIRYAMIRSKGCQRTAAAILGTKATTLHAKIKRYGIENFAALGKI